MSVVGIDFGAQSTKIGVARNKGIDIVSASLLILEFESLNVLTVNYRLRMKSLIDLHRKISTSQKFSHRSFQANFS